MNKRYTCEGCVCNLGVNEEQGSVDCTLVTERSEGLVIRAPKKADVRRFEQCAFRRLAEMFGISFPTPRRSLIDRRPAGDTPVAGVVPVGTTWDKVFGALEEKEPKN